MLKRLVRLAGPIVTIAVLSVVVVLALINPGVATTRVDLNDGGVWVTNASQRMVAHLNFPSKTLDAALIARSTNFDLTQHEEEIHLIDNSAGTLNKIDTSAVALKESVPLTGISAQGGGMTGYFDAKSGKAWLRADSQIESFSNTEDPLISGATGGVMAMGTDGSIHVASIKKGKVESAVFVGQTIDRTEKALDKVFKADAQLQVSAVGGASVVLDGRTGNVQLPSGQTLTLAGKDFKLQLPGPAAESVLVSSSTSLFKIPLDGSKPVEMSNDAGGKSQPGVVAAPALVRGCAYAAWGAGAGRFLRHCQGGVPDERVVAKKLETSQQILFRVNRDVIVLNDIGTGDIWLPDKKMLLVNNWEELKRFSEKEKDETESPTLSDEQAQPQRSTENHPPVAQNDQFGARPGRTTTLPVLANDSDEDGDILTASADDSPSIGTVKSARNGAALQITLPETASGSTAFKYTANDGRSGTAQAQVAVTIRPWELNEAPKQSRITSLVVGQNAEITYNALGDWLDPDGDPLFLATAGSATGLDVKTRQDGAISIKDIGARPGFHSIKIRVSDGKKETEGEIRVQVRAGGNIVPVANADHLQTQVGVRVTANPLKNDTDANGDQLSLVSVGKPAPNGPVVTADLDGGTFSFEAENPGTYYVPYVLSDGPNAANGLVRIDVAPKGEKSVPVAEDDLALLPEDSSAVVDVLANDSDPQGQVLAVQAVQVPQDSGLIVSVVDRRLVRVSAPRGLGRSTYFNYTVSNGDSVVNAQVNVLGIPAVSTQTPPEAKDDSTKVRVGDVASVEVLENDRSPAGLSLTVVDRLDSKITADQGTAFVSDNLVRFRAGNIPGTYRVSYSVKDTAGNIASAQVSFEVVAKNGDNNQAPRPRDLQARVLSGQSVRIPIPTNGIDPDGDSTVLSGISNAPSKGVAQVGPGWINYTAGPNQVGTDTFSYQVEDRLGKQAEGKIRVGVIPAAATNSLPVAVGDAVLSRPGRRVQVAVLNNDTDADGDRLSMVNESLGAGPQELGAKAAGSRVAMVLPEKAGTWVQPYTVSDGRGGLDKGGMITVTARADAPLRAPIARDDVVSALDVNNRKTVTVNVLNNDEDPDGSISELLLTSSDPGVRVSGQQLVIDVQEETRSVLYTLTDMDGLSSSALVRVPGYGAGKPYIDVTKIPVTVKSGEKITLPLSEYVITRNNRSAILTDTSKVRAALGADGENLVQDSKTLVFGADKNFSGMSAISFEVTDGTSVNDDTGLRASLTIPIKVIPAGNQPPKFTPTKIQVAPGEKTTVDLSPMVKDPDGASPATMRYSVGSAPSSLSASISGTQLTVSATTAARKGSVLNIPVTVNDGSEPVNASLPVEIVGSTKPLIAISPINIDDGRAGVASAVDVSRYATNPFPGQPLRIVGSPQVVGAGNASVSGTTINVTPAAGQSGQIRVSFRLGDATNDPTREVNGSIVVTVRDKPAAPTGVNAQVTDDGQALVRFTSGAANGSPITGYTVRYNGGSVECGQSTTCTVKGLKAGQHYSFTVTATNAIGESAPSAPSAAILVDAVPSTPTGLKVVPGDQNLKISWNPPTGAAKITGYIVTVGPSKGEHQVAGTSFNISGLKNGTKYTVSVKAVNSASKPSPVPAQGTGIPFGRPGAPKITSATTQNLGKDGANAVLQIKWSPSAPNGREITSYTISAAGRSVKVAGGATSGTISVPRQASVSVTVQAESPGGKSDPSAASTVKAYGAPAAPTALKAEATGESGQAKLVVSGGGGNGWSSVSYEYSTGGAWNNLPSGGMISGLTDGKATSVRVRAVGRDSSQSYPSLTDISVSVNSYGKPVAPTPYCSGKASSVQCQWGSGNGHGRPVTYSVSTGGSTVPGGWDSGEIGYSQHREVCVTATQKMDNGQSRSDRKCGSATSGPKPNPIVTVARGAKHKAPGECDHDSCGYVDVTLKDFANPVTCKLHVTYTSSGNTVFNIAGTFSNGTRSTGLHYGYPGQQVWVVCGGVTSPKYSWPRN